MNNIIIVSKIVSFVILIIFGFLLLISIVKSICSNFNTYILLFFKNMTLSDEEHKSIDKEIKQYFKDSSLYKILNNQEILENDSDNITSEQEKIELLLQTKDFYKDEIKIFSNDFSEFLKKIDFMFKMFSIPVPIYISAISYILEKRTNTGIEYVILTLAIIVYLYYFIRVIWIQSLKNGYSKIPIEFPFLIKNITLKKYIESYIVNSAVYLKIQRKNLLRLKEKIQYIHIQYVISSAFIIFVLIYMYVTK